VGLVVGRVQAVGPDPFMSVRRMDKLAAADINADVGNPVLVRILEKDQIAGLGLGLRNRCPVVILLGGSARQVDTVGGTQDKADKAGAVKAGAGSPAHDIPGSTKRVGGLNNIAAGECSVLGLDSA